MQDFLGGISGPEPTDRTGDYAELQVGPAFTQMQTFDVDASTTLEWTEFFGIFEGDPVALQGPYAGAIAQVEGWLASPQGVNDTDFLDTDAWLASVADSPVTWLLAEGSPWGAVEEIRRAALAAKGAFQAPRRATPRPKQGVRVGLRAEGASLAPGLTFDHAAAWANPETKPWCELASYGRFTDSADTQPLSYQIGDEWLSLMLSAEAAFGTSWLLDLHIGVALADRGDVAEPQTRFARSLAAHPLNPIAARCLAVLMTTVNDALPLYHQVPL
jgi:hypothetical protein